MKPFLTTDEEETLVAEISAAEQSTSGEIRVVITSRWIFRPMRHAWKLFHRLGMDRTANRNAALIVLFARRRRFVVIGDHGIAAVVGPDYWQELAGRMTSLLREGRKVEALSSVIRSLGATMTARWPAHPDHNPDELPNHLHHE